MRDEHPFFKVSEQMQTYRQEEDYFLFYGFSPKIAEKVLRIASLSIWDAFYIFQWARDIPDGGTYLEIGSHLGGSLLSAYFGTKYSNRTVNFIAIEKNITIELLANTRQIPRLEIINLESELAKTQIEDGLIDLLFIDADHRYSFIKMDLENYWPKVKKGGVLLGHDYNRIEDVKRAVNEFFWEKIEILANSDIWKVQK